MRIKSRFWILGIIFFLFLCTFVFVVSQLIIRNHDKKIAVVDVVKLFNEYHMKQELEKKAEGQLRYLSLVIDSLKTEISVMELNPNISETALRAVHNQYGQAQVAFERAYEENSLIVNDVVWKRLNPLLEIYGKQRGFHLIIGATGKANVLYLDDYFDQTDDLIKYVNEKYDEGN